MNELQFMQYLNEHGFSCPRTEHPPVFTCEEADRYKPQGSAVSTKNLFLCDKKARRFLLAVTSCERTVQLDRLAEQIGVGHLRFGSEENLMRLLGVTRGSVTMMGLVHDEAHQVELWIDSQIWQAEEFLSHPLVNSATLIISKPELERFFELTGHQPKFFE